MDREAWHAATHGVAKSWTRLNDWTELNWFKIPDTFLKILLEQQTSGWVQPGQVGLGWSPRTCSQSEVQRRAQLASDKAASKLANQVRYQLRSQGTRRGHGRVEKAHGNLQGIMVSGILESSPYSWRCMFSHWIPVPTALRQEPSLLSAQTEGDTYVTKNKVQSKLE